MSDRSESSIQVIGVDPGPTESAYCVYDGKRVVQFGKVKNEALLAFLPTSLLSSDVVCESVQSFGMPVGKEVFDTCIWIGRYLQALDGRMDLVGRKTVVTHVCNDPRAKDANVRQAMLDLVGPQGTKKNKGPTYGISKDCWSALAISVYAWDTRAIRRAIRRARSL